MKSQTYLLTTLKIVGAAAVLGLMANIIADIGLRSIRGSGVAGTIDTVRYWWMVGISFGGLAVAERLGAHISAPVLFDRLPPVYQVWWQLVGATVVAITLALMAWFGWQGAVRHMDLGTSASGSGLTIWPTRFLVPLGAALYAGEVIRSAVLRARRHRPVASVSATSDDTWEAVHGE